MKEHIYKTTAIESLIPYANNSRTHSDEQVTQVASSIKEFGFTNPVLVDEQGGIIAGHGRVMAAKKLGLKEVPTIVLQGLTEAQKKAYVIADNQLALNSGWDLDMLRLEVESLQEMDFDLDLLGFGKDFMLDLLNGELCEDGPESLGDHSENPYTTEIKAPIYEPKNEKPRTEVLRSRSKADSLIAEIKASGVTGDEKAFLIEAAERHTVFDFSKIADYYAHSGAEMQDLMEKSALVIIDYNKAIEGGFVRIMHNILEQHQLENSEDDE